MPDIMDLPPEIRAKVLARMGVTLTQYDADRQALDATVEEARADITQEQIEATPEKFQEPMTGTVEE